MVLPVDTPVSPIAAIKQFAQHAPQPRLPAFAVHTHGNGYSSRLLDVDILSVLFSVLNFRCRIELRKLMFEYPAQFVVKLPLAINDELAR